MKRDYTATIIKIRDALNLSQSAFAKLLGVPLRSIVRLENGEDEPNKFFKDKVKLLCDEHNIPIVEIPPDYELIKKVCELTCSKDDVVRNQTTIAYDSEYPFKKYYDVKIITGAIKKYASGEWDDQTLAHWACIYCWILSGGFDENLKENLNSFENFFKNFLTWDLDGLSFFNESHLEDGPPNTDAWIVLYEEFDHIWQTRDQWLCYYGPVGPYAVENEDQYVVFVNDMLKEYMILYSDHLENGYEDPYFRYVTEDALIDLVAQLKEKQYRIINCSEEFFYSQISDKA